MKPEGVFVMLSGNYCPLCKKCYADDDWDCKMIQCSSCESWVHAKCEGLTGKSSADYFINNR